MTSNILAISVGTLCLLVISGCGTGTEKREVANTAPPPPISSSPVSSVMPSNSTAPIQPAQDVAATAKSNKGRKPDPQAQIGTGGNDFFLFTRTRSVLDADSELKTTSIIIGVKGGVLTLNGTVPNSALKMKAEQLVRTVDGVKEVKNLLHISS
ncbi:MAG TPA: BON domain-containing protein [Pyrinomonadaceae bacterium]